MQRQINKIEHAATQFGAYKKAYSAGAKRMLGREVTKASRRHARLEVASAIQEIDDAIDADELDRWYAEMLAESSSDNEHCTCSDCTWVDGE